MDVVPGRGLELDLGEKQELFSELEARWVLWVLSHPGWELRQGEGRILQYGPDGKSGRRARIVGTGEIVRVVDLVHKEGGAHHNGLAKDWQLFVKGRHITSSDAPEWITCGEHWESMHGLCRWGGRWGDGNHISLIHDGVS